jgi:hypothetical protein
VPRVGAVPLTAPVGLQIIELTKEVLMDPLTSIVIGVAVALQPAVEWRP